MNLRALLITILLVGGLALAGCGSKGPLYLPGTPPDTARTAP